MKDLTMVLGMVKKERKRQDEKWGFPQNNTPFEWMSILMEETGELAQAFNDALLNGDGNLDKAMTEAIQVAAVAVSIVQHLSGDGAMSDLLTWESQAIGEHAWKSVLNAFVSQTTFFSIREVCDGERIGQWHWRLNVCRAIFDEGYAPTEEDAKAACLAVFNQLSQRKGEE